MGKERIRKGVRGQMEGKEGGPVGSEGLT